MLAVAVCTLSLVAHFVGAPTAVDIARYEELLRRGFNRYEILIKRCSAADAPVIEDLPTSALAHQDDMHIVYTSDQRTFGGLLPSLISFSRHQPQPSRFVVHVVVAKDDWADAQRVIAMFRQQLADATVPRVELHVLRDPSMHIEGFTYKDLGIWPNKQHLFNMYYIHEYLLPSVRRALWLDTDTIIRADVSPLFSVPMRHALGAVPYTPLLKGWKTLRNMRDKFFSDTAARFHQEFPLNLDLSTPIFNTGVLLFDLTKWRSGSITRSLEVLTNAVSGYMSNHFPLNVEFAFRGYDWLEWHWNVECGGRWPERLPQHCIDGARILHWEGEHKPFWKRRPPRARLHDDLFLCGALGVLGPCLVGCNRSGGGGFGVQCFRCNATRSHPSNQWCRRHGVWDTW